MSPFENISDVYAVYIQHPVISKWLAIGLCISLLLNTYLFNASKQAPKVIIQKVIERVEVPVAAKQQERSITTKPTGKKSSRKHNSHSSVIRTLDEAFSLLSTPEVLSDEEIISIVQSGKMAPYALEKVLGDFERAVHIRRALISRDSITQTLEGSLLPVKNYHYDKVMGACCENVIGYMPIPVGVAGKFFFYIHL